ncbi:MAG: TetR/AcrR family transcriptional regulator [Thermoplasmatota archaeon]
MARSVKKPGERRQEFIRAAETLFMEKGYQNTSVSHIVNRVGVAHGLFYYYFDSKEDVLDAIIEHLVQESRRRLSAIVHGDGTPLEKFHRFVQQMFVLKKDRPYLIGYMLQEQNRLFYHKWMQRALDKITPLLTEIVEEGVTTGRFDTPYPREAVEFIFNGMRFFLSSPDDLQGEAMRRKIIASADMMERVLGAEEGSIVSMYREMTPGVLDMMDKSMQFADGGSHAE